MLSDPSHGEHLMTNINISCMPSFLYSRKAVLCLTFQDPWCRTVVVPGSMYVTSLCIQAFHRTMNSGVQIVTTGRRRTAAVELGRESSRAGRAKSFLSFAHFHLFSCAINF